MHSKNCKGGSTGTQGEKIDGMKIKSGRMKADKFLGFHKSRDAYGQAASILKHLPHANALLHTGI